MSLTDWFTWPRDVLSDIRRDVAALLRGAREINARLKTLEIHMADVSPLLNQLAEDLRTWSAGPFAELLAENARLASRNAELEGEDAAETAAADNAVSAFNRLVAPVTETPDVPVEIPPVEVPAEELVPSDGAGAAGDSDGGTAPTEPPVDPTGSAGDGSVTPPEQTS